jgi:hypothetical protein
LHARFRDSAPHTVVTQESQLATEGALLNPKQLIVAVASFVIFIVVGAVYF